MEEGGWKSRWIIHNKPVCMCGCVKTGYIFVYERMSIPVEIIMITEMNIIYGALYVYAVCMDDNKSYLARLPYDLSLLNGILFYFFSIHFSDGYLLLYTYLCFS